MISLLPYQHTLISKVRAAITRQRTLKGIMDYEQEKKQAEYAQSPRRDIPPPSTVSGMVDEALSNQCSRQNLKEALASRIINTQERSGELLRLTRLAELADKNPETFEMLQLMRDTGLWY